jgi:hypothetical protein
MIYQLKIELAESDPMIWRRLTVPGDTPFDNLHDIIQISMGWDNEYPYQFTVNETTVRDFEGDLDMGEDPHDRDVMDTFLEELVTMVKAKFTYIYNLDDRWQHTITLEEILPSDESKVYPVCLAGEGACPPEDCGGISHYQRMLRDRTQKKSEDRSKGESTSVEPEGAVPFNIKDVNARLKRYSDEWEEIYRDAGKFIEGDDDNDDDD